MSAAHPTLSSARPSNRESFTPQSTPSPMEVSHPALPSWDTTNFSAVIPRMASTVETDCLAHDARNWLTVLKIYCDLLRNSGAVGNGYEKWMEELSGAVDRGHELMNSLLDSVQGIASTAGSHRSVSVVRSSSAPSTLSCRGTDSRALLPMSSDRVPSIPPTHGVASPSLAVSEAIARRLPLFERLAGKGIQVELDSRGYTGNIALPESAFERILQNLVGNAIDAMPNGGHLRITLRPANRRLVRRYDPGYKNTPAARGRYRPAMLLRVYDSGIGVAPDRLPHIFEAGFSGKPECKIGRPRHGFGLSIVRELTESAGGTVRVRSHPGWGSCFEVELPTA